MKNLRVIDFFCGAGGFSEGFRQADFRIIKGIDNWAPAIRTHNINHILNDEPMSVLDFEDIAKIHELPDSEIIVGSPPCVSFSLSNKGGGSDKSLGIRLIEAYLRVVAVKKHQPNSILKAWLMENVPNSKNYVQEKYTFRDLNLESWAKENKFNPDQVAISVKNNGDVLKASNYGAAQARNRFVCGEITETGDFPYPNMVLEQRTVKDIRSVMPEPMCSVGLSKIMSDPNYPSLRIMSNKITDHYYDTGVYEIEWQKAKAMKRNHPYMGRMSFPENEGKPSRTIMATRSASTREAILYKSELERRGDGEYRLPTIREAASIMGFPLSYVFYGNEPIKWRQVGNAVCPQMSFALANSIRVHIGLEAIGEPTVKAITINKNAITFLDDHKAKSYDSPPKKSQKALFRSHPVKSGNMTVSLTNKHPLTGEAGWASYAFTGTGKGYRAIKLQKEHKEEAMRMLRTEKSDFLDRIRNDSSISHLSADELDELNSTHHYNDTTAEHPLSLISKIAEHIEQSLASSGDKVLNTGGTIFESIKSAIPLSQIMAIYAVGTIIH